MTNIKAVPRNRVIVTVEKQFEDEVTTESGIKLYKDTTFNPTFNVTIKGKVVAIPNTLADGLQDIVPEVEVGDTLYFNYGVLMDPSNGFLWEARMHWMVDYYNAIATVRSGSIIPIGSYVLVEGTKDEEPEMIGSLYVPDLAKKRDNTKIGIVRYIGQPLRSMAPIDIHPGDQVVYEEVGRFENEIEGKTYFCMYQDNILAKCQSA